MCESETIYSESEVSGDESAYHTSNEDFIDDSESEISEDETLHSSDVSESEDDEYISEIKKKIDKIEIKIKIKK